MCHTTLPRTAEAEDVRAIESHLYLEFENNGQEFVALTDGGARTNVIGEDLVKKGQLKFQYAKGPKNQLMRWGKGDCCEIVRWLTIPMTLANGHKCRVKFAVIGGVGKCLILGRPFLKDIRATIDHHSAVLTMPSGPILLLEGYASNDAEVSEVKVVPEASSSSLDPNQMVFDKKYQVLFEALTEENQQLLLSKSSSRKLSPQLRTRLQNILLSKVNVWGAGEKRGTCKVAQYRIDPIHDYPIVTRPRRHPSERKRRPLNR